MRIMFWSKAEKPFSKEIGHNWAKILLHNDEQEIETKEWFKLKVAEPAIFVSEGLRDSWWQTKSMQDIITTLLKETPSTVVLACKYDLFIKVMEKFKKYGMKPKARLMGKGTLFYTSIGKDRCVLLVAYDRESGLLMK